MPLGYLGTSQVDQHSQHMNLWGGRNTSPTKYKVWSFVWYKFHAFNFWEHDT